ncbi:MAG: ATP synthase F1 subunit gamma [Opitutales bacterium]|nr:ATP synthase F1 subunit gamma [Opitutales bacterium]
MPNLRDIKRRIRSVKNTGKITRAMQLVASSKMKRAQTAAIAARPYAQMLAEVLASMPRDEHGTLSCGANPFLEKREVKTRGVLILSTDKGLAGALNANMFRFITTELKDETVRYFAVGRKGSQFLARTGRDLAASFSVSDRVPYKDVRPVVESLTQAYIAGEIDTIEVLYPRFINNLRQEITLEPLAPIPSLDSLLSAHKGRPDETAEPPIANDTREMLFEPDAQSIINEIIDLYIRRVVHHMMLEAQASEQSARMVAMKTATDNAKDLEGRLTLKYNKARQTAITQELVEISAATMLSQ